MTVVHIVQRLSCVVVPIAKQMFCQGNDNSASDLTFVKQRDVTRDDCDTLKEALYEVLADIQSEGLSLDQKFYSWLLNRADRGYR